MPKNKVQDAVFTAIMAIIMVYGMIVYNVALNTGGVSGETFLLALHELPVRRAVANVLLWPARPPDFSLDFQGKEK